MGIEPIVSWLLAKRLTNRLHRFKKERAGSYGIMPTLFIYSKVRN